MKRIYSMMFALVLCSMALNAQYFTEDFEGGLPAGWTLTGEFSVTNATDIMSQYFAPGAHTQFVGVNDDKLGNGVDGAARMETAMIDLTAVTGALVLTMESFFINGDYQGLDETAKVFVSTDGTTWTELWNIEVSGDWQEIGTSFPYAGQQVWLAFEYADGNQWNYGWCLDDIKIQDAPGRDIEFVSWNEEEFFTGGFEGGKVYIGGVIKNNGGEILNSIDFTWTASGTTETETISGLSLGYNESMMLELADPFILPSGTSTFSISVGNSNGGGEDIDPGNDASTSISVTTITPHPDKGVLVEEATGTWCQWCPRGAVFMDGLSNRYPEHFVGVAVHNSDPMAFDAYDDPISALVGNGYPNAVVERGGEMNPADLEAPFAAAVQQAPPARLNVGAELDGNTLTVSVDADAVQDIPAGYKLAAIVIEGGVTGTGSGYVQINSYGGGNNGPMGGFELFGGAVAAEDMVYNHVGRGLIGGFNGDAASITTAIASGEHIGYTFPAYTIAADNDMTKLHIAGVLLNAANKPVNAFELSLDEAVANGLFVSTKDVFNHNAVNVFPNPFTETATLELTLESSAEVSVQMFNAIGQSVLSRDYGTLTGNQNLTIDGADLESGVYFIHVRIGDTLATKRVTLTK